MTVRLDVSGLVDGQHVGLGHFSNTYAYIGVRQQGGVRRIEYRRAGQPALAGPVVEPRTASFKIQWGLNGRATMAYSLDHRRFVPFGDETQQTRASYRGSRVGVFTYHEQGERGHVDVDIVEYTR